MAQVRHICPVDVGTAIVTPFLAVSDLFQALNPALPFQRTRYFMTGIDEVPEGARSLFSGILFP